MTRLKSEIFCAALVRTVFAAGGFGAVVARGADEAGAIYIQQLKRHGTYSLYGPAPQMLYMEDASGELGKAHDRLFEFLGDFESAEAIEERLNRERKFDPDIWIVELECEVLPASLNIVEA